MKQQNKFQNKLLCNIQVDVEVNDHGDFEYDLNFDDDKDNSSTTSNSSPTDNKKPSPSHPSPTSENLHEVSSLTPKNVQEDYPTSNDLNDNSTMKNTDDTNNIPNTQKEDNDTKDSIDITCNSNESKIVKEIINRLGIIMPKLTYELFDSHYSENQESLADAAMIAFLENSETIEATESVSNDLSSESHVNRNTLSSLIKATCKDEIKKK